MNPADLTRTLDAHRKWLNDEDDGARADLSGTNLSGAYLSGTDLSGTDLSRADLSRADLSRADLSDANLSRANLSRANLSDANLSGTCLDPQLGTMQRTFCRACPPVGRHGGRIVYRTRYSQHIGHQEYAPGHTYTAPVLSFDAATACHPGIYAASLDWMRANYTVELVRCYVRDGDWAITAKGAIRCRTIRILGTVEAV